MSTDLATRTAASLVAATSRKLGVDLPKPLAAAFADADRLRSPEALEQLNDASLTAAVADAIFTGRDVLASKDVQRAVTALTLSQFNIEHRLSEHAYERSAAALQAHADAVIETWRPVVVQINAAFVRFRAIAPGVDPLDPDLPAGLPTKALTPWGEAKDAAARLEQVAQGWRALASVGVAYMPEGTRPLVVADLTFEQLDGLGLRPSAQDVARFDVPLDLATTQTFAERVERISQERGEHREQGDAASGRARRQQLGDAFGVVRIPAR